MIQFLELTQEKLTLRETVGLFASEKANCRYQTITFSSCLTATDFGLDLTVSTKKKKPPSAAA